jgi:hypothetical protein
MAKLYHSSRTLPTGTQRDRVNVERQRLGRRLCKRAATLAGTGTIGTIIVAVVPIASSDGIYAASRRRPINADNVNDVPAPVPATASA